MPTSRLYQYDVFLVTAIKQKDRKQEKLIMKYLQSRGLCVCSLDSEGNPGATYFKNAVSLLQLSKKVAIVCTKELIDDNTSTWILDFITFKKRKDECIFLIDPPCILENEYLAKYLMNGNQIFMNSSRWLSDFVETVSSKSNSNTCVYWSNVYANRPRCFCELPTSERVVNSLRESNQFIDHTHYDLYGVLFTKSKQVVTVIGSEFLRNIEHHRPGEIRDLCESFDKLATTNTQLRIVFEPEFNFAENQDFLRQLAELFNSICHTGAFVGTSANRAICHDKAEDHDNVGAMRMYKVEGPIRNEKLLLQLNAKIRSTLYEKNFRDNALHPEYADYNLRLNSFKRNWQHAISATPENMAEAGFFRCSEKDIHCFYCGFWSDEWFVLARVEDPITFHVHTLPTCGYIQDAISTSHHQRGPFNLGPIIRQYKSIAKRKHSFENINFLENEEKQKAMVETLAAAGLFHYGLGNVVMCFKCYKTFSCVGLVEGYVWPMHAGLSPSCPFVLKERGRDYIKEIQCMREKDSANMTVTFFLKSYGRNQSWHEGAVHVPGYSLDLDYFNYVSSPY